MPAALYQKMWLDLGGDKFETLAAMREVSLRQPASEQAAPAPKTPAKELPPDQNTEDLPPLGEG